jgi:hypothetical protein
MKNLLVYYRVVSYVLVGIAVVLSLVDLLALVIGLSQPPALISAFILAGVIIYSFASFSFLLNGIQGGRPCKPNLKDWIKVNAYVAVIFGALLLMQNIAVLANPANMNTVLQQMNQMQAQMKMPGATAQAMMGTFKAVLYAMIVYSLLLLSHIYISLRFVKQYAHLFGEKDPQA